MPELPEVETVARLVRPGLLQRRIRGAQIEWPRTLLPMDEAEFEASVIGTRIVRVWRRAKYIVIDLERRGKPSGHLLIHLRMTGRLHVVDGKSELDPYERVRLELERGKALAFIDVRKFGRLTYVADTSAAFAKLGPEPLGSEFTPAWFSEALRARRRALKPLLLDQSFLAGLGNIYVDEALHRSRLHPLRSSEKLSKPAAVLLHTEIQSTLAEAIEREGSSFDSFYRTPEGQPGSYQHQFQVYGRQGQPCKRCSGTIRKFVVAQRGTHICPRCQRAPRS